MTPSVPVALVALCIIVLTHALQCAGRYRHARGAGRTHHRCCKAQSSGKCCACPALPQAFRPISSRVYQEEEAQDGINPLLLDAAPVEERANGPDGP